MRDEIVYIQDPDHKLDAATISSLTRLYEQGRDGLIIGLPGSATAVRSNFLLKNWYKIRLPSSRPAIFIMSRRLFDQLGLTRDRGEAKIDIILKSARLGAEIKYVPVAGQAVPAAAPSVGQLLKFALWKPGRHWGWAERLIRTLRIKKIVSLIERGDHIVDIGCGQSKSLWKAVSGKGITYVGVDPLVEREEQDGSALFVRQTAGSGQPLSLPSGSFDKAISLAVLEHVDDPDGLLAEIFRLLKPGGRLILTTPTALAGPVLKALGSLHIINPLELAEHKRFFSRQELEAMVKRAGFTDFKHEVWELRMNQLAMASKPE